jgi:hypothetical protein
VLRSTVSIKLRLQRSLVLFTIWARTGALRSERHAGARGASSFNGYVAEPFRYANRGLLHRRFAEFKRQAIVSESRLLPGRIRPRCPNAFTVLAFASAGRITVSSFTLRRTGFPPRESVSSSYPRDICASRSSSVSVNFGGIVVFSLPFGGCSRGRH